MAGGSLKIIDVFAMCVNSAIGAGILAVPWVYLQIGYQGGLVFTAIFFFISTISSLQAVENVSLCETLKKLKENGIA